MGKIFYLMGKSGSGKDTIYSRVKEQIPELRTIVIYTTRPIRDGEAEGVEYHFVNEAGFRSLQDGGKVIEYRSYNTIHGIWTYFTVDDGQFDTPEHLIAIGTLESYRKLKEYFGAEKVIPLYIEVEDGLRLERALKREQKPENRKFKEMCRRFLADSEDFSEEKLQEAGIVKRYENIEVDVCVQEIVLCIQANL